MAFRERYCPACTDDLRLQDPGARAIWHDVAAWPHDQERPDADVFAIHDDHSFRRAYGPGAAIGLGKDFETRASHRQFLKANHLAERDTAPAARPKRERGARLPGLRRTQRSVIDHAPTD